MDKDDQRYKFERSPSFLRINCATGAQSRLKSLFPKNNKTQSPLRSSPFPSPLGRIGGAFLSRYIYRSLLSYYCYFNLSGESHFCLYFLCYFKTQFVAVAVSYFISFYNNP